MIIAWKARYARYQTYLPALFFIGGFVFDSLTLTRVDYWLNNLVLGGYLFIAGAGMILINLSALERLPRRLLGKSELLSHLIQFSFGALFSGYIVYYFKSASFAASWIFMLLLAGLFIGNEFFRKRYLALQFHIGVLYFCLFSFLIFFVPVTLRTLGDRVFLFSGALSLGGILLYTLFLRAVTPERLRGEMRGVARIVFLIFLFMNGLYFSNIIPPIPLSLKELVIAHSVAKKGDGYTLEIERRSVLHTFIDWGKTEITLTSGAPLYAWSAVFAPASLSTRIVHRWEYFDSEKGWQTKSVVAFPILGGREEGYRGYSLTAQGAPGRWRVSVETERGQVIGRTVFTVVSATSAPALVSEMR